MPTRTLLVVGVAAYFLFFRKADAKTNLVVPPDPQVHNPPANTTARDFLEVARGLAGVVKDVYGAVHSGSDGGATGDYPPDDGSTVATA